MKVFARTYKDHYEVGPDEHYVFPEHKGDPAIEVQRATVELCYMSPEDEWSIDVDVWGYTLTKAGKRDKRQNGAGQVFGLAWVPERQKFIAELADQSLKAHGLTRDDIVSGKWVFEGVPV